jgi:hypothetical protein
MDEGFRVYLGTWRKKPQISPFRCPGFPVEMGGAAPFAHPPQPIKAVLFKNIGFSAALFNQAHLLMAQVVGAFAPGFCGSR